MPFLIFGIWVMLPVLLFRKVVRYPMSIFLRDTLICKRALRWLTHWGWLIIFVNKLTIIGSDNGLPPGHYLNQCWNIVTWTSALGSNVREILIEIYTFSLKKMHLKTSSGKCLPFCLGLNVFTSLGMPVSTMSREVRPMKQLQVTKLMVLNWSSSLQWRHNEHSGASNNQPRDWLLSRLFIRCVQEGGDWFHLVRLSIRPSVRPPSVFGW